MSRQQPSFTIKSSHRFVNPVQECDPDPIDYYSPITKPEVHKPKCHTDNVRKEGSQKGMVIRTTNTSVEDYY